MQAVVVESDLAKGNGMPQGFGLKSKGLEFAEQSGWAVRMFIESGGGAGVDADCCIA